MAYARYLKPTWAKRRQRRRGENHRPGFPVIADRQHKQVSGQDQQNHQIGNFDSSSSS